MPLQSTADMASSTDCSGPAVLHAEGAKAIRPFLLNGALFPSFTCLTHLRIISSHPLDFHWNISKLLPPGMRHIEIHAKFAFDLLLQPINEHPDLIPLASHFKGDALVPVALDKAFPSLCTLIVCNTSNGSATQWLLPPIKYTLDHLPPSLTTLEINGAEWRLLDPPGGLLASNQAILNLSRLSLALGGLSDLAGVYCHSARQDPNSTITIPVRLMSFRNLVSLEKVKISGEREAQLISSLATLKYLSVNWLCAAIQLEDWELPPTLESLSLQSYHVMPRTFNAVWANRVPNLTKLSLNIGPQPPGATNLETLMLPTTLKVLELKSLFDFENRDGQHVCVHFDDLPVLQSVILQHFTPYNVRWEHFPALTSLCVPRIYPSGHVKGLPRRLRFSAPISLCPLPHDFFSRNFRYHHRS